VKIFLRCGRQQAGEPPRISRVSGEHHENEGQDMSKNILIAAAIAVILGAAWWLTRPAEEPATATASTALASGVHLDALDRGTRPQDDFYRFVNGGWLDATAIPEIYSGYTVYHTVYEDAETVLREIIEDAAANPGEPGSEQRKVGDFYATWMDAAAIDAAGIKPQVSWGTSPEMVLPIDGRIPDPDAEPDPGRRESIARALAYLLEADVVTGQILFVDGGRRLAPRGAAEPPAGGAAS